MNRIILMVVSACLALLNISSVRAQYAAPIFSFDATGTNGASPEASLTLGPDGNFYGTTETGGTNSEGTVFRITTGGALTTLVNFNGTNGANPLASLILGPDGNFYGTTEYGGNTFGSSTYDAGLGDGTIFQMTTNGVLTTLVSFAGTNGSILYGGLTLGTDGNFYGTTGAGGPSGSNPSYGTVFKVTTNGTLTTLTNFDNANGATPHAGLALGPDGNFYGTTESEATNSAGTVFKVTPSGALTTLYVFGYTATNGADPQASLILGPDGNLYGTTMSSGIFQYSFPPFVFNIPTGNGTVYKITTNGVLTTLVDFDDYNAGISPHAALTLGPDDNFYATTYTGGTSNLGTAFEMTAAGTLTTLASFNGTNGAYPLAGLTLGPDGNFYGNTVGDGAGGNGTIYELELPPEVINGPLGQSVIIGNPATFSGTLFGTAPYGFQWLSNSIPVIGATGSTLKLPSVFWPANDAEFQLAVTNAFGSETSQIASLTVILQPNSYAVTNNGNGQYTVLVGSTPDTANRLWSTTNLTLPMAAWSLAGSITTDATGKGEFLDTDTAGEPVKFYRLSYP